MLLHGIARPFGSARIPCGARLAALAFPVCRPGRCGPGDGGRPVGGGLLLAPPSPSSLLAATLSASEPAPPGADAAASPASDLQVLATAQAVYEQQQAERAAAAAAQRTDKVLAYDPALIAAIGNQSAGGHAVCCPGYACAYGDAVLTGKANDHAA